jgi:isoquinoline 1-oxidoreductase alpha subunit
MDLVVNGAHKRVEPDPKRPLLWVLRHDLDITGPKYGCGEGQCGACTVLVDGEPRKSCITPVISVSGKRITTIEGLCQGDKLHPLQQAFIDCDAMQCGYCTPGMILTGSALLRDKPSPSESEIREAMQGNICRCGTYNRIIAAIQKAATFNEKARRDA